MFPSPVDSVEDLGHAQFVLLHQLVDSRKAALVLFPALPSPLPALLLPLFEFKLRANQQFHRLAEGFMALGQFLDAFVDGH